MRVVSPESRTMDRPVILIVDDEVTLLRSTRRTLEGHFKDTLEYATAVDVPMALYTAHQFGSRLKVLITDQLLGMHRGTDLAKSVRFYYPNVGVLIFTGYLDGDVSKEFEALSKPAGNNELVERVSRLLTQVVK